MKKHSILAFVALTHLLGLSLSLAVKRPNIVLIMADGMGYSDIGCYGGEIPLHDSWLKHRENK